MNKELIITNNKNDLNNLQELSKDPNFIGRFRAPRSRISNRDTVQSRQLKESHILTVWPQPNA
jgi:hypothetical protein